MGATIGAAAAVFAGTNIDDIVILPVLFRTIGPGAVTVTVAVFAVLVAVWCAVASWLGSHRKVIALVERSGRWLVPVVFMVIGAAIVAQSMIP
ncbi:cadmium resistance transporter [Streptosporangium sp. NPDC004379]|uniref:cadmium resistance transporter n=1 Tax=Streptosporangium sp. NPDC004379 TaxID=3366189 RepID=UPI003699B84C